MRKSLLVLPLLVALASCTTKTEYVYMYKPRPTPVEPMAQPANMRGVEWKVLNKAEMQKILAELEKNPDPNFALFALTPKGFEALSTNLVEINRFVQEQQQVIAYYRAYTAETADVKVPTPTVKPKTK